MKWMQVVFLSSMILLASTLAACGAPPAIPKEEAPVEAPAAAPAQPKETISPGDEDMPKTTILPELQPLADKAIDILADTLNVSPDEITILEIKRVEWRDASLGCPKPGMMYAQVITPGYLVKAEVNGEPQMVHMNETGHGVVCPPDMAKPPYSFAE